MRIPLTWLREYAPTDMEVDELAELMTHRGVKVEAVLHPWEGLEGVVVARVLEVRDHPNSDHQLDLAGRVLQPGEAQLVGVRMVAHLEHARSDDPRQPLPRPKDVLDLGAARRQQLGELLRGQVGGTQLAKP